MKRISLFLSLWLLMLSLAALSSDELYNKLQKTYSGFSSFQAAITQENRFAQLNKTLTYTGNIYFTPGKMVIRYDKPAFQRLQITGGYAELYDAGSKTLFRSRIRPEFGKMNPVEILQLYWKKSKVTLQESKGVCAVSLIPNDDPLITSLSAQINVNSGIINSLAYRDANGNKVSYSFSKIKTNAAIPAAVWKYTYPKNIQVVQQ